MLRATQTYVSVFDRANGSVRVTQTYVTVLAADPIGQSALRATQCYVTVLDAGLGKLRATQLYVTILENRQLQGKPSMGAVADLKAAPKTFEVPGVLSRFLDSKVPVADVAVPAAYAAKNEVQNVAIYSGTVSGGTFTMTIKLRNKPAFTTAAIAFNAAAATIQTAIDAASPATVVDGDIVVTGGPLTTTPLVVTYSGATVSGQNHGQLTIDGALLAGGGSVGAITTSTEGQTVRNARAVMLNLGLITDATPPVQGLTTAPTAGANLLRIPPWVVRELAQEVAFEDGENSVYQSIITALLGYTDSAPLVSD